MHLEHPCWAPEVKEAVNGLIDSFEGKDGQYVVSDFDNTTSVFDIEHQLAVWQLHTMAFAMTPSEFPKVVSKDIGVMQDYGAWVKDVSEAYSHLYDEYGPFDGEMIPEERMSIIRNDPWWSEFAVKMRAMFSLVNSGEPMSSVWLLYWFTGMTEDQVYRLAYASHVHYRDVPTVKTERTSPAEIDSMLGVVTASWTDGITVTENVKELWKVLHGSGIDVWVCSASGSVQVQAAIDAFGLHKCCSGMYGMNIKTDKDGKYIPEYDHGDGSWYVSLPDGTWRKEGPVVGSISRGMGKVDAIVKGLVPRYGHGPVAGFMDSTGDYEFCTMFSSMELVVCYNRVLDLCDGGGLISTVALYERDVLGYGIGNTGNDHDTLYVLQGRDENGPRSLLPGNGTKKLGKDSEEVLAPPCMEFLQYLEKEKPSVKEIFDTFWKKTSADGSVIGEGYGFLSEYRGYRSI
ncbi:MAG: hypothetical protein MJZ68_00530 [archaeon]|nr:hypothetical protein [archaeon]